MPRWERKWNGQLIRGIKKTKTPNRSHTHYQVKIEFLDWARETNHSEAWRGLCDHLVAFSKKLFS